MRLAVARGEGLDQEKRGVLVIAPSPKRYAEHPKLSMYFASAGETYRQLPRAVEVEARAITWEQVADVIERRERAAVEVSEYLRWRLANIR